MIADRDIVKQRCCQMEETEMLQYLERAMRRHVSNRAVQRCGLQLFEEILKNATNATNTSQILSKVFQLVLDNLMLNISDPAICHSSFAILSSLAEQRVELLLPWMDHILNLAMTTIANLYSAEVVYKCLVLLHKISVDDATLITIAAHERGLMALCDSIGILTAKHLNAAIYALEILLRSLEDTEVRSILLAHPDSKVEFLTLLRTEVSSKFDKYLVLLTEFGGDVAERENDVQDLFLKYHQIVEVRECYVFCLFLKCRCRFSYISCCLYLCAVHKQFVVSFLIVWEFLAIFKTYRKP